MAVDETTSWTRRTEYIVGVLESIKVPTLYVRAAGGTGAVDMMMIVII